MTNSRAHYTFFQVRPYLIYEPSYSKNPEVQLLEKKIDKLMKKLREEESHWVRFNVSKLEEIKDRLDLIIGQRNALIERDEDLQTIKDQENQLSEVSNRYQKLDEKYKKVVEGATFGFVWGGLTSYQLELNSIQTSSVCAVTAATCAYFNHKYRSKSDKS